MSHLGEFDLIERIAAACHPDTASVIPSEVEGSPGIVGIGDDCAVIPQHDGVDTLVTTDLLIEDRHFLLADVSPFELGWKSAAVNISDIAAMGGKPTATFLSIALPKGLSAPSTKSIKNVDGVAKNDAASTKMAQNVDGVAEWVDQFIAGFRELSARFGVPLLGGDTSASPDKLFINVTVLGECPHGQAVMRSGARSGDLICVTGPLGDSAAGLKLILDRASLGQQTLSAQVRSRVLGDAPLSEKMAENSLKGADGCTVEQVLTPEEVLIRRHYMPMPRVEMGQALAALTGVHAMMDISDGIASDLRHILKASSGPNSLAEEAVQLRPSSLNPHLLPADEGCGRVTLDSSLRRVLPGPLSAEIDLKALPLSEELKAVCAERGWDPVELAVGGGEDYELLFTAAPGTVLPEGCTVIGRIVDIGSELGDPSTALRMTEKRSGMTEKRQGMGGEIRWIGSEKEYKGFTHF